MSVIYLVNRLIDGTGNRARDQAALWVEDGRVKDIMSFGEGLPAGVTVVDLGDRTLLPGLIDMHVHVDYWYGQPNVMEYMDGEGLAALLGARNIRSSLEIGVTTVRDVASGTGLKLRRAVELGYIPGSRIFTSAKGICMTGGHGHECSDSVIQADGPDSIRKAVREQARAGADLIKILTSHRSEKPEYRQEELDAGVDEAHRLGFRVACHAGIMPGAKMAILAGVDTIEHGTHLTNECRELMAERGTFLIPTMIAYHSGGVAARRAKSDPGTVDPFKRSLVMRYADWWIATDDMLESQFRKAAAAGIKIAVGTDMVMADMDFCPIHTEMEMMVKFGYGEMNTICAATRVAAEALGKDDILGTLEKGKFADFVVVEGNPLTDISALRNVHMVVKEGRVEIPVPVPYFSW
ncbi:MAG TPA: amidohydrolase family protein [Bacillota bacterium]|nr:amidohydrolase family protein [Bacillota bacterium]